MVTTQTGQWLTREQWQELLHQLSQRPTRSTTVWLFAADLGLMGVSWWLKRKGGVACTLAAWILLTLCLIQFYLILHEAAHSAVSRRKWLNNLVGHVCGWIFLLPFLSRQRNHLMHHVWTAHPTGDPENRKLISKFSVMTRSEERKLEFVWRYWLPVITLNHFIGTWRDPFETQDPKAPSARLAREMRFARIYAVGYALVAASLVSTANVSFFLAWFLPPWIVLLGAVELLNLPHHAEAPLLDPGSEAPPYWRQAELSHNCGALPVWSSFVILNFNLHIAHHAFPKVPWYHLPLANRLAEQRLASATPKFKNEFQWSVTNRRRPLLQVMGHFFDKRGQRSPSSALPPQKVGAAG